jgi:hypothetical protein
MRIAVVNSSLAGMPGAGALWAVFVHLMDGLLDLGHDVTYVEVMQGERDRAIDARNGERFGRQMAGHGLDGRWMIARSERPALETDLDDLELVGGTVRDLELLLQGADVVWNVACALRGPLLDRCSHRVLVDLDPGLLQIYAEEWPMEVSRHHGSLTIGGLIGSPSCPVPTLGLSWQGFFLPVNLGRWPVAPDPGPDAPVAALTAWSWDEESAVRDGRIYSASKRRAFLRYAALPTLSQRPFTLATDLPEDDPVGDREMLENHGWRVVDSRQLLPDVETYRRFVEAHRAEVSCPKPAFRELRTGWISDRTAAFLAAGRPVIMEDTGISELLPTGEGLLVFKDYDGAMDAVARIDREWDRHATAARRLAETHFDTSVQLPRMLDVG